MAQKTRNGGESSRSSTVSSGKTTKTTPLHSSIPLPPTSTSKASASTSTTTTSGSSSLHASPRLNALNTFSAPIHFTTDSSTPGEQPRQSSSPRLGHTSVTHTIPVFNSGVNGTSSAQYPSVHQSRMRASTSNLPGNAYSNANQAALLQSLPATAHVAAQAATAAAVAANLAASSQHYRSMTSSSASSPSSSTRHSLQQQYLFQHQPYQPISYEKHTVELTNCIIAFLSPILPTEEEYRIKEATRRQLERLAGRVSPGAKLLAFGSMANGFALRNSDMDLCCLIAGTEDVAQGKPAPSASELVEVLGKLIREETDYTVMPLPKARIPIIKISRAPTSELPYEISCDIGFENGLALENTRLLLTYAMVDPPRLRTLVLFLKVWTKRRKINSPYTGTLSSYGYTLLMIFFLTHVKRPSVLPNLQKIPPSTNSTRTENVELNGHNIYFYDDVATLRREWASGNTENVGELLIDFFRYFSKEFVYSKDVISIRTEAGLRAKDGQIWTSELCIEDPFQAGYNVARTVTRDGLYTIRGEFMRASRILTTRSERVSSGLAELCEEREDGLTRAPDTPYYQRHRSSFAAPSSLHQAASSNFDPRYLQDLTRRYDLSNNATSGFGGSFAFEEMARGLGQAQKSNNVIAYPPTTAMLAPLSQNTGLSPRQHLMRAGLRYDTPRRGQAGAPTTFTNTSINLVGSSARSEDGSSNYDKRKSKVKSSASSNISAHTSPNIDNAVPSFLQPSCAASNNHGVGEALAFGSEISFGSQRFQLHPQSTIAASRSTASRAGEEDPRNLRSFSEGLNRSLSLPRSGIEGNDRRRSSTPLLSEPTSPSKLHAGADLPDQKKYLDPSMAGLSLADRQSAPRSSISDSGTNKRISVPIFPSQAGQSCQALGGLGEKMQMPSSSPFLPPSPWSSADPSNNSRDSRVIMTPEEDGSFGLDDEPASISDAGESGRLDASQDQSEAIDSVDVQHDDLTHGKEHDIRSWAASQSIGIHSHADV